MIAPGPNYATLSYKPPSPAPQPGDAPGDVTAKLSPPDSASCGRPVPLRFRAARALPALLVEAHRSIPADARDDHARRSRTLSIVPVGDFGDLSRSSTA